jgi:hypothetical protein
MAVKISELYEDIDKKNMKLIAGKNGMQNLVKWVRVVENKDILVHLKDHVMTFITGISLEREEDLFELVKLIHENAGSGIIINIGPFIKEIPKEVIEFCDEYDFPLFQIPWHINLAEIMREFSYKITLSLQSTSELIGIFKNAIFFVNSLELYVPQLEKNDFNANWSYSVAVIEMLQEDGTKLIDKKKHSLLLKHIEDIVTYTHKRTIVFELDNKIVLIFANYDEKKIINIMETVKEKCIQLINKKERIYFCIGNKSQNIKSIAKSYRKALDVLKLQKGREYKDEITLYRKLGAYKLLLSIEDKETVNEYYQETIEDLFEYDKSNKTDYVLTLDTYLKCNGSLKEVASRLFYHRNTINYKLNKIQEILSCDLSEFNTRLTLSLALMLKKIM